LRFTSKECSSGILAIGSTDPQVEVVRIFGQLPPPQQTVNNVR
jgi:hypothetical protein